MTVDANRSGQGRVACGNLSRIRSGNPDRFGRRAARNMGCPLPQILKIALLSTAIMVAFCVRSDAQQMLSAAEIKEQIVGQGFQGRKGIMSVSLHYASDGTVTMRSPLGTGSGHWIISDDRLCVKMETGPKKADECLTIARQPDGTYRASNGLRLTPAE